MPILPMSTLNNLKTLFNDALLLDQCNLFLGHLDLLHIQAHLGTVGALTISGMTSARPSSHMRVGKVDLHIMYWMSQTWTARFHDKP